MLDWYKKRKIMAFLDEEFSGTKAEKLIKLRDLMDELIAENKAECDNEREQKRLNKELEDLLSKLDADWKKAPYYDKIRTETKNGITNFYYRFEDGESVVIDDEGKITYDTDTHIKRYKVNIFLKVRFINFANQTQQGPRRNRASSYYGYGSAGSGRTSGSSGSSGSSYSSSKEQRYKNPFTTKGKYSLYKSHPKWDLYQTLIITVVSRTEQLNNLPNNSDERTALENELNATIGRVKEMILKYRFD
jgi:hypothetical protein